MGLEFRVSGFGLRVSGLGFRVSGLGFRVSACAWFPRAWGSAATARHPGAIPASRGCTCILHEKGIELHLKRELNYGRGIKLLEAPVRDPHFQEVSEGGGDFASFSSLVLSSLELSDTPIYEP